MVIMKNHLLYALFLIAGTLLLPIASCQKDVLPTAELPPISFNQRIMPIIASNCTASGCHGQDNTEEFTLLTYEDVIQYGEVVAMSPSSSKFYNVIKTPGTAVMPPSPNLPLSDEQIALVYLWILQGAKNN